MLIDPVAGEGSRYPPVPPRLFPYFLQPGDRGVPVVMDVVVVEQHRGGHHREQPADRLLAPRLPVEARVLLVVGDVVARLAVGPAALSDEASGLGSVLVGIDL